METVRSSLCLCGSGGAGHENRMVKCVVTDWGWDYINSEPLLASSCDGQADMQDKLTVSLDYHVCR